MTEIAQLLTHPGIMVILLAVGLIGLTVELMSPGVMWPGIIGGLSFVVFFWATITTESMGWEVPAFFVLGVILLILEVMLPTMGIIGVLGTLALLVSLAMAASNLWVLVVGFLLAVAVILILYRFFGLKVRWNQLILRDEQKNEAGYTSSGDRRELLGKVGVTLTPLRPSGFAKFGESKEDVVSEGEIIPSGVKVKVIAVEGVRVVVRKEAD